MVTFNSIQEFCRALPYTTEDVKWGSNLVFSVGNKMYAVLDLEHPEANSVTFKCSPQDYERFIQLPGIIPAPYAARFNWVKLENLTALEEDLIYDLLKQAHEIVFSKLSKKLRTSLNKEDLINLDNSSRSSRL